MTEAIPLNKRCCANCRETQYDGPFCTWAGEVSADYFCHRWQPYTKDEEDVDKRNTEV